MDSVATPVVCSAMTAAQKGRAPVFASETRTIHRPGKRFHNRRDVAHVPADLFVVVARQRSARQGDRAVEGHANVDTTLNVYTQVRQCLHLRQSVRVTPYFGLRCSQKETPVSFWDGSTPAMRFGFFGFCGAFGSVLVRLVAMYFDSRSLAYLS